MDKLQSANAAEHNQFTMTIHADQIDHLLQYISAGLPALDKSWDGPKKRVSGDEGLLLWDKWSQCLKNTKPQRSQGNGKARDRGITIGTVIYLAKEQGFSGQASLPRRSQPMQRRLNRLKPKAEVLHGEANSIWTTCNRSDDYVANHPYKPKLLGAYAGRIQTMIWPLLPDYSVVPCGGVDRGLLVGVETIDRTAENAFSEKDWLFDPRK